MFRAYANEFEIRLFPENKDGLPVVYNRALEEVRDAPRILVFIHDDVHFLDLFWPGSIREGLANFDLIGVAGCKRHYARQASWMQYLEGIESVRSIERSDASGVLGHLRRVENADVAGLQSSVGGGPVSFLDNQMLSYFGPARQQVCLLDGVLLACNSETLIDHDIRFDERFDFHFYDMDLCRQFERNELRMGTWSLSILHASYGNYDARFGEVYLKYVTKWAI